MGALGTIAGRNGVGRVGWCYSSFVVPASALQGRADRFSVGQAAARFLKVDLSHASAPHTPRQQPKLAANLRGGLWMVLAMACFAAEDALVKSSAASLPVGQVMVIFGGGGTAVFACALLLARASIFHQDIFTRIMLIRLLFEACGRLFFILAVTIGSLSTATVILQATPIVVIAAAWLVFGERPRSMHLISLFVGTAGVIIVLQPSFETMSWTGLVAVVGMIGFAGRDLASRASSSNLRTEHLGFVGFMTILGIGACYSFWEQSPYQHLELEEGIILSLAVLAGAAAYSSLMKAMRTGEVSAVAPFRYFRLVFGVALGVYFFGEELSHQTMLGAALIVFSGLLLVI